MDYEKNYRVDYKVKARLSSKRLRKLIKAKLTQGVWELPKKMPFRADDGS